MKRVVFIAGTAFSGSTMLDMMLGNSRTSFSAGEVRGIFQPRRLHHINPACGCGNSQCIFWSNIKGAGIYNLYHELFKRVPQIETIIDSSKDPFWIHRQQKNLKSKGISTNVILIWKTPGEFALSRLKRNLLKSWQRAWINYHRLFFTLIEDWRSIRYLDIVREPERKLKEICGFIGVPFTANMEKYWEKRHHTIFGNTSAKFHVYEEDSEDYKRSVNELNFKKDDRNNTSSVFENRYRSIYYDTNIENLIPKSILLESTTEKFDEYISLLKFYDVETKFLDNRANDLTFERLSLSRAAIELYRAKRILEQKMFFVQHLRRIAHLS